MLPSTMTSKRGRRSLHASVPHPVSWVKSQFSCPAVQTVLSPWGPSWASRAALSERNQPWRGVGGLRSWPRARVWSSKVLGIRLRAQEPIAAGLDCASRPTHGMRFADALVGVRRSEDYGERGFGNSAKSRRRRWIFAAALRRASSPRVSRMYEYSRRSKRA